ncbi:MAG: hypothetical protein ACTSYD_12630 [Candidatus Heimdallarchaeaceae archaeon]
MQKQKNLAKNEIDYLHLTWKQKGKLIFFYILKWGGIILAIEALIWLLIELLTSYSGYSFFTTWLLYLPAILLIYGGCIGGLSRYHVAPKLRIIEPDDQTVIPDSFQIRVKYDPRIIVPETIKVFVNDRKIPTQLKEKENVLYAPKIFKAPPKKASTLSIKTRGYDRQNKEFTDQIRIICDPEADKEDYEEYWEFKREDETYWGKEMIAAQKNAKRTLSSLKAMTLAVVLFVVNVLVSQIYSLFV